MNYQVNLVCFKTNTEHRPLNSEDDSLEMETNCENARRGQAAVKPMQNCENARWAKSKKFMHFQES